MARYTGPKHKIARREKANIFEKNSASLERRLNVLPGAHGQRGGRRPSGYGIQLREKQKAKRIYGVLEKQFRRYFEKAAKKRGVTGEALLQSLELRLDNVIYRLNLAKSRNQARQFITHNHVLIDSEKVTIPSFEVKTDQVISLSTKASEMPDVKKLLEDKNPKVSSWLERKAAVGRVLKVPSRNEIDSEINEQLIVEFYSR